MGKPDTFSSGFLKGMAQGTFVGGSIGCVLLAVTGSYWSLMFLLAAIVGGLILREISKDG